ASSLFIQASEWQQKKMLLDLEETVRNAYLRVLEAQHAFAVADHSMKTLSKQQEISQAFFEQGIVTKRDTLSVELQLSQKKRDFLAAKNGVARAKMELNRLIGNEITAPIELQELSETVDADYNDQKIVEYALRHRPELKALSKRSEGLAKEKQALKLSNAPNFYAFTNADFSSKKGAVSAGIGLHMPIFEGGKSPAQIAKVRAQKREVDETLRDFRERLEVDIQVAVLQLKEERDNFENGKLAIELGEGNFTKTGDLYKEGQASINDLLYAEEQLSASHLRYHSSLYRYYSTLYRLSTLAGGYPINNEETHE
ncbi:MAG TPA: TolC family protein, partial [Rhabdochlamydiaceae bacterium]